MDDLMAAWAHPLLRIGLLQLGLTPDSMRATKRLVGEAAINIRCLPCWHAYETGDQHAHVWSWMSTLN